MVILGLPVFLGLLTLLSPNRALTASEVGVVDEQYRAGNAGNVP